ncbi:MAG: hypothetical protein CVU66_00590 [Deltaproteobacteria bacterium HGW-Deltaproteobacteria-23]|nr:MAG: hypothetical protein CVU66_00590 [Deltaproteobacteria bacterium HGW-Deltaproteobacteria-23]
MLINTAKKIKKLMIDKGVSGAAIARKSGVERSAISHVIAGRSKSPLLRQSIAAALNVPIDKLWPDSTK